MRRNQSVGVAQQEVFTWGIADEHYLRAPI